MSNIISSTTASSGDSKPLVDGRWCNIINLIERLISDFNPVTSYITDMYCAKHDYHIVLYWVPDTVIKDWVSFDV